MIFGGIIIQISSARFPKDVVMALENSILDPEKTYIHGFGAILPHLIGDNSVRIWVVSLHGCGRLGAAQLFECCTDWFTGFGVVELPPPTYSSVS